MEYQLPYGFILFVKSLLLGLAIAAPLGPIGALCINRTLERGFATGVAGGLGTALADGIYAILAAIGFAAFSEFLADIDVPLHLIGGLFMLWLGWKSLQLGKLSEPITIPPKGLLRTISSTFFLTIANPMTILSFAAIFAGLGMASTVNPMEEILVVSGVFSGSMLWWIILSGSIAFIRHRLSETYVRFISQLSGGLLIGFGLWALLSVFIKI